MKTHMFCLNCARPLTP